MEEEIHYTVLSIFLSNLNFFKIEKLKGFCVHFLVVGQAGYPPK